MTKLTFVVALFALTLAACKKNDQKPPPPPAAPVLSALPGGGKDTLSVGDSLKLIAKLTAKDTATYIWKIGGQSVGADSIFTYHPTARGDYQITIVVSNQGGSDSAVYYIHVYGAYENGFFIINEGIHAVWDPGTKYNINTIGTISFFRYDTQKMEDSVYTGANPGKDLGPANSIPEYGAIWDGKLYVVCEAGGPIVQADPYSLQETGRVPAGATDWRAFLGIDSTHALVSSNTGIYMLNLATMTMGGPVSSITGQVGDMTASGNYIFVISQACGLVALNKSDYSVAQRVSPFSNMGFAKTVDGGIWAGGTTGLVRVDPSTLDTITLATDFPILDTWVDWHPGCIATSPVVNTFWFGSNYGAYAQACVSGTLQPLYGFGGEISSGPPISYKDYMYADGLGCDSLKGLYAVTVLDGQGNNYMMNQLWLPSGAAYNYSGFYFPAMLVFH